MRILQVITLSELGGAQSVVINLSNYLSELGHEVVVVAGEGDGKMFEGLDRHIIIEKLPTLVRRLSPIKEVKSFFALKRLYDKYNPDIIHLHSSKAGLLGRFAFPKKKIVYTVHGFDSIRLAYRRFLPLEKLLQSKCAAIVGVSKYDEQNLIREGITKNVSTVYNGIYEPSHLLVDPFSDLKQFDKKVLCIARLTPQKKHELFIEVARRLPDVAFIWIGNQKEPDFEYPKNVVFKGNIIGAGAYTEYADLFFLPSNYEGLPMVIIESLSMGTPVLASAVGGITELLNGKNGIALPNDAKAMADFITKYFSYSSEERARMSECAVGTYNDNFTVNSMVNGYLNIYKKIMC